MENFATASVAKLSVPFASPFVAPLGQLIRESSNNYLIFT